MPATRSRISAAYSAALKQPRPFSRMTRASSCSRSRSRAPLGPARPPPPYSSATSSSCSSSRPNGCVSRPAAAALPTRSATRSSPCLPPSPSFSSPPFTSFSSSASGSSIGPGSGSPPTALPPRARRKLPPLRRCLATRSCARLLWLVARRGTGGDGGASASVSATSSAVRCSCC
ncbi:hypothetical protein BDY21DRAFT_358390 [Lineolata rhizophorae]|uniref:Uncharacterized protein n=1 Tax=Lineolata rhizophorae TaxID=578093 RepID=A0A6A6NLS6_9PEZI|nr:hypothetical protein BDY21DRAFT_358390 [Lineolata rhizophorae]